MATYLVFSDDWGRHPSSCQHLTQFLLREENRLLWVNTIGTRPPRLDWITLKRGGEKLFSWFVRPKRQTNTALLTDDSPRPEVFHPLMWPWFRHNHDRWLNRILLRRALKKILRNAEKPIIGITTLPIVADVMRTVPQVDRWVYYCVDDWSLWPGMDSKPLEQMEAELVAQANTIITAGKALQRRILQRMGRKSTLITHGVDLNFWRNEKRLPPDFVPETYPSDATHPIYMFWGLIDERMDLDMIRQLSNDISRDAENIQDCGTIAMIGPVASPAVKEELLSIPYVEYWGLFPYAQLPQLAELADVLMMPYYDMKVTRQMQPLKLTEYLATGKPAVVRELPATEAWQDALDVVSTVEDFSRLVRLRAKTGLPETQRLARQRLEEETWEAKAILFEKTIQ